MSESKPTLANGTEYVVLFEGGPFDGQTDKRISTDGTWDDDITVLVETLGHETMMNYDATSWREVGDVVHVTYTFDAGESEEIESPADRRD